VQILVEETLLNCRRSRSLTHGVLIVLALLVCNPSQTKSQQTIADPIFGITYDPQRVHFDAAPASIVALCRGLQSKKLWVYARWGASDTQYFVVSETDFGIAVALHAGRCTEDQSEYFLRKEINTAKGATPIEASDSVLEGIAMNALERYSRAFGGKATFLKLLSPSDREALPPVLQKELRVFEKKP
jgi:hypothetical protein